MSLNKAYSVPAGKVICSVQIPKESSSTPTSQAEPPSQGLLIQGTPVLSQSDSNQQSSKNIPIQPKPAQKRSFPFSPSTENTADNTKISKTTESSYGNQISIENPNDTVQHLKGLYF